MIASSPTAEIVLSHGARYLLGYTKRQLAMLYQEGVISHLAHRAGCGFYYRRSELLVFKRQARLDPRLAETIEALFDIYGLTDDEDDE